MLKRRNVARLRQVAGVFMRHGFDDVLESIGLLRWLGGKRKAKAQPEERLHSRAVKFRLALEELGTTYIKLGQILSTRPDLLPRAVIDELAKLQDDVDPVEFEPVAALLEDELGRPLHEVFERFDEEPVASASIAQVYRARLRKGISELKGDVAVKVVKPGIAKTVESDMEILQQISERLEGTALGRRYDFRALSSQLEDTLLAELDLRQEALNAGRIRHSLEEYPLLRVAQVAEELTSRNVLVMEYISGTKLTETTPRSPALAAQLWQAYLKQILVDGAFHCDPHPGNLLLDANGSLALLDFGMMAFVSRENQLRLMSLLITLVEEDGDRAARACIEMGIPGRAFREERFRAEVGLLVARYSGATIEYIPFGEIVRELLVLCVRHDIQVPPEMILLGKALLNLEPLCRGLDPDLDPIATMKEMAGRLLEEQVRRDINTERLMSLVLEMRAFIYDVPLSVRRFLTRAANNELQIGVTVDKADQMQVAVRDVANRITLGLITSALIMGSAFLLGMDTGIKLWGYPVFSLLGFLMAAGLGIYVVAQVLLGRD